MLLAAVLVAVGTVALVARRATEKEFDRFVQREQLELRTAVGELGEMGAPGSSSSGPRTTWSPTRWGYRPRWRPRR